MEETVAEAKASSVWDLIFISVFIYLF